MPPADFVTGTLAEIEDAFAGAVVDARRDDRLAAVTVLVGHVLLKRYLPRMLASRDIAHINVRFLAAHDLAEQLSPAATGQIRTRLTPGVERFLVRQIAATAADGYFASIARGDGFADALLRLFREFEAAGFESVETFTQTLLASQPDGNVDKVRELAVLYAAYIDRRGASHIAGRAAAFLTADPSRLEGRLLVYGVWDPAELYTQLLEHIVAQHPTTFFLVSSGLPADEAHERLRDRLASRAIVPLPVRVSEPAHRVAEETARPSDPAAAGVAERLFHTPGGDPLDASGVALVSAPDTVREVWEAARACLRWAKQGIPFHEMAVVYRNREPYRGLIDEIFGEAKIDTYIHDGRPIAPHPLGRRLLTLIDLVTDPHFSRRSVMDFLTETQLPTATINAYPRITPALWDTYSREAGVVEGIDQWRSRLTRLAAENREKSQNENYEWLADVATRVDEMRKFIDDLHAELAARPEDASWDEHLAYLTRLAARYAADVEPLLKALGDLRGLEAVEPRVSFDAFCRAVRDDLESRDASDVLGEPVRAFGRDGVAVLDATSVRHLRFRAVYLVGAAERAWPPPPRPDPLLLEHERASLNEANAGRVPMRTSPDTEALTFWLAIQSAREHLAVSYARADASSSGKHLPSYFFRAMAEAMLGGRLNLEQLDASGVVHRFAAGRLASDDIADALSDAEYDRGLLKAMLDGTHPAAAAAIATDSPAFGRAIEARAARWSTSLTAFDGVMHSRQAIARAASLQFGRERAVSPSRLEMYAACPYRYFLKYVLGIQQREEPEHLDRIDHLERGSLVHAILERFLKALGRDDPPSAASRTRHIALLLDAAREEGREREARGVTGRPLLWALDREQIHHDLIRWYDAEVRTAAESPLRPGAFEVGFGGVRYGFGEESELSTDDALVIDAAGHELRLQGRLDRVDWDDAKTRFRVIDYKTGRKFGEAALTGGQRLQLPIYLHAAARALGIDASNGEAQYFYVSGKGGFRRTTITGADLLARSEEFDQVLTTIAEGVDSGFFAPEPRSIMRKGDSNCTYCDFNTVCDARISTVMARKADDPRLAAYRRMEEIP